MFLYIHSDYFQIYFASELFCKKFYNMVISLVADDDPMITNPSDLSPGQVEVSEIIPEYHIHMSTFSFLV